MFRRIWKTEVDVYELACSCFGAVRASEHNTAVYEIRNTAAQIDYMLMSWLMLLMLMMMAGNAVAPSAQCHNYYYIHNNSRFSSTLICCAISNAMLWSVFVSVIVKHVDIAYILPPRHTIPNYACTDQMIDESCLCVCVCVVFPNDKLRPSALMCTIIHQSINQLIRRLCPILCILVNAYPNEIRMKKKPVHLHTYLRVLHNTGRHSRLCSGVWPTYSYNRALDQPVHSSSSLTKHIKWTRFCVMWMRPRRVCQRLCVCSSAVTAVAFARALMCMCKDN